MACAKTVAAICVLCIVCITFAIACACAPTNRVSKYQSACYEGLTSGMMPSIDRPPPTPCGPGGIAEKGERNCCSSFGVPPNINVY